VQQVSHPKSDAFFSYQKFRNVLTEGAGLYKFVRAENSNDELTDVEMQVNPKLYAENY
jgi:hypothetical protein